MYRSGGGGRGGDFESIVRHPQWGGEKIYIFMRNSIFPLTRGHKDIAAHEFNQSLVIRGWHMATSCCSHLITINHLCASVVRVLPEALNRSSSGGAFFIHTSRKISSENKPSAFIQVKRPCAIARCISLLSLSRFSGPCTLSSRSFEYVAVRRVLFSPAQKICHPLHQP